jgi:HEAT repeat protein
MNARRCFPAGRFLLVGCLMSAAGCQAPPKLDLDDTQLRQRAMMYLKRGVQYEQNAVVRAQAIEALQDSGDEGAVAWIREATRDPEPGVRFAACMALGTLRDERSAQLLLTRVEDENPNVRIAAVFAIHRMKDYRFTNRLADALIASEDPAVRGNAAVALGRLGEKPSIRLLRRTEKDADARVRLQGLEAAAMLGDERAIKSLILMTHGPVGAHQAFAALALGQAGVQRAVDPLRIRLAEGPHLETRLAAARALGMLGYDDGFGLAVQSLTWSRTGPVRPGEDPPDLQTMRVKSSAALALGAIGNRLALPYVYQQMEKDPDPRVQLSAADAILSILNHGRPRNRAPERAPIAQDDSQEPELRP